MTFFSTGNRDTKYLSATTKHSRKHNWGVRNRCTNVSSIKYLIGAQLLLFSFSSGHRGSMHSVIFHQVSLRQVSVSLNETISEISQLGGQESLHKRIHHQVSDRGPIIAIFFFLWPPGIDAQRNLPPSIAPPSICQPKRNNFRNITTGGSGIAAQTYPPPSI